jgi:glutamate 5-kinase
MTDLLRQEIAATAEIVVIKVGTRVLTQADGTLHTSRMEQLAEQLSALAAENKKVVLVSSGAVGAGMSQLGLTQRPENLSTLQAVAAVGQTHLIQTYDQTFSRHGQKAAQVLLTAQELNDRTSYLNVRNTLLSLLSLNVIPIINENDTVSVDELLTTFGDNDRLAALVTNLLGASLLIVLSNVPGLLAGDPEDPESKLIPVVTELDENLQQYVTTDSNALGKGGMSSKLEAARIVTTAGGNMIIASGNEPGVVRRLLQGEPLGTLFLAQGKVVSPWKRWIAFSAQPRGKLILDKGACQAICSQGGSLLAIGITALEGSFDKGDVVDLCGPEGTQIARGLTNYSALQMQKIKGCRSNQFAELLGHQPYEEVVHRDNLALLEQGSQK